MRSVQLVQSWPVDHAAAAVVRGDGTVAATGGEPHRVFELASVTKLLSAYAALIALEEGAIELDQPAGPDGSTVHHLLAHTSGLAFDSERVQAEPGTRRIYSNTGFAVLAETIAAACEMPFAEYLREAVCVPLGLVATELRGSAGAGAVSTAAELAVFAGELLNPSLIARETYESATTVHFPGLDGVLPGYGIQRPNDWGLGLELRAHKQPHWTGTRSSPRTFGHFGQSGTFLWVDPDARLAAVALTDRPFGEWAKECWPAFTDAVLEER
ncbi:serine hydrolase domain-containing protein [Sciscionella marina]|uniref:serine hydrolase domain-containing protein n=1 Tax=Sciscionella marina TaxID=508770 RepID=UPI0004773387|nr:serine hydrolase domain-containing protein [Sciscionella marina]